MALKGYHDGRIEIKIALLRQRKTQKQIARKLGITEGHLSLVISGKRRSRRVLRALARELQMPQKRLERMIYGGRERRGGKR